MTEEFSESVLREKRQDEQESNRQTPRSSKEVRLTPQRFVRTNIALAVPKEHVASYIFLPVVHVVLSKIWDLKSKYISFFIRHQGKNIIKRKCSFEQHT